MNAPQSDFGRGWPHSSRSLSFCHCCGIEGIIGWIDTQALGHDPARNYSPAPTQSQDLAGCRLP
jgi:hypothetical protein